jgi:D-aminopeptidase
VGNGFGKAIGFTQIEELGNLETPIALSNTLSVFSVADALVDNVLTAEGNAGVRSVNPVAGETNDGWLNDIRGKHVKKAHVLEAINRASSGPVAEGNVGAGTGTLCLGYKGGIGTSSRVLAPEQGGFTVGALVQTNFGGLLRINGIPVGEELKNQHRPAQTAQKMDGSCMIVIATDAPLSARNLERLAKRSFLALGRVGSYMSNGSGDYAIAFSTHPACRVPYKPDQPVEEGPELANEFMSPLFLAVVEAVEEAIYNSLFMAEDMTGLKGRFVPALPLKPTLELLDGHQSPEQKLK